MVKFLNRLMAYAIDFLIFLFVVALINSIIPSSTKLDEISKKMSDLQNSYIKEEISMKEYLNQYEALAPSYDKENIASSICNLVFILGYFVIAPLFNNGQTIGKKLLKIRVVKNKGKLTVKDMIIRNFITTSLLELMLSSILVYILPGNIYLNVITIIGFMQIALVITTSIMIIYRKDKKGVQDLITGTLVEEVNYERV